jgi:uncharacterized LabA/DUF88 family protein
MSIHAYIDESNLFLSFKQINTKISYKKLFIFLKEKYKISDAFMFVGYIKKNDFVYSEMIQAGFKIIYKDILGDIDLKGNCDCELVLQTMRDFYEYKYTEAIILSGDGDFACLVRFLNEKKALARVIAPRASRCSIFLKRTANHITFLEDSLHLLLENEKAPGEDNTSQGSFS